MVEARSIVPHKTGLIFPDCLQLQCVFSLISASGVANHDVMLQLVTVDSTAAPLCIVSVHSILARCVAL